MAGADAIQPDTDTIERVGGISVDEFIRRFRKPRRPVVLTDAMKDWPALQKYTPEYFIREYADVAVRCAGKDCRLGDALAQLLDATADNPGPYPCTVRDCKPFIGDISPRFGHSLPNRHTHPLVPELLFNSISHLDIFFGGPGSNFPFPHYDYLRMHGWVAQVYGDKEFTLFDPGQEHLFYVDPERPWRSTMESSKGPDPERYPLFAKARGRKTILRAGETIFIPCGTWHAVRSLNASMSIVFDQLESSNWREFCGEVIALRRRHGQPVKAAALGAYLWLLGPVMDIVERLGANKRQDWGVR
jgi:hypothetical protein